MSDFRLSAKSRTDVGKGASRRLRRADEVPAIIYGGSKPPANISVPHKDILHELDNEAFFTSVLTLSVDGQDEPVVLKDLQRHPSKPKILHADFLRIDESREITMRVPLHFLNEDTCIGVKQQGGIVAHAMTELEVNCLPRNLPEYIEVDLAKLEVGDSIHISDLKLPEGVESVDLNHGEDYDLAVANVIMPRGGLQEEAEEAEAAAAEGEEERGEESTGEEGEGDDEESSKE